MLPLKKLFLTTAIAACGLKSSAVVPAKTINDKITVVPATRDTIPEVDKSSFQINRGNWGQASINNDDQEIDPHDFWAFSIGYVNQGDNGLFTPKGLYWEGITPGFGDKGSNLRRYTGFRGGIDLIKEGEFGFSYQGQFGPVSFAGSARKIWSEGYVDALARFPIGNENSPLFVQPYGFFGVGAGFLTGNTITNYNATHLRYGVGATAFLGFRQNHKGFGLIGSIEAARDKRVNSFVSAFGLTNPQYKDGLIPRVKLGAMLTF